MKVKNIFSKHISFGAIVIALVSLSFGSCKENIDDSDLYTFTGEMLIDHLVNHPDTFSSYVEILGKVHPSKRSKSTMKELLSARGNYTCFAPTNEAIAHHLDSLFKLGEIPSNQVSEITDSLAEAIVFNSIIENGDNLAYSSTEFTISTVPSTLRTCD